MKGKKDKLYHLKLENLNTMSDLNIKRYLCSKSPSCIKKKKFIQIRKEHAVHQQKIQSNNRINQFCIKYLSLVPGVE